jgi:putative oxidoreductase
MCDNTYRGWRSLNRFPVEEKTMAKAVLSSVGATGKGKNIALWVLQVLAAAVFVAAGSAKLAGAAPMVALFSAIGVGQWFRYVTGGIEVVSAILLLVPGRAAFGAALLVCTMIGAVLTHLTIVHSSPAIPLLLLIAVAVILWGRRDQIFSRF